MMADGEDCQVFLVPNDKSKGEMEVIDRDVSYMQEMLEMFELTTRTPPYELQARFNGGMLVWAADEEAWSWQ